MWNSQNSFIFLQYSLSQDPSLMYWCFLAQAIKRDSSFARKVKRVVVLGGAFFALGNVNPAAEANVSATSFGPNGSTCKFSFIICSHVLSRRKLFPEKYCVGSVFIPPESSLLVSRVYNCSSCYHCYLISWRRKIIIAPKVESLILKCSIIVTSYVTWIFWCWVLDF